MATKTELEKEIKELKEFKEKVRDGLINVLTDNCEEAAGPVANFRRDIRISFPMRKITLEFEAPYGDAIDYIELVSGDNISDFEIIEEKPV